MESVPTRRRRLHALLSDFDAVLAVEYDALRKRNSERLTDAIAEKQRLATALDAMAPTLAQLKPAESDPATEEWEAIQRLLSRCALANRTNGAAIDASRSFVTSLIDILTGRPTSSRTYNARGHISSAASRNGYTTV